MTQSNDSAYPSTDGVGLTKRELFAAMAMQAILSRHDLEGTEDEFSASCVRAADSLIAALSKEPKP